MTDLPFYAAFSAVLLAAAVQDVCRRRISNLFPIMLVVLFACLALWRGETETLFLHIGSFTGLFLLGAALFSRGIIGGGDVKLMAAAALWFEIWQLPALLLAVALCGGAMALLMMARQLFLPARAGAAGRYRRRKSVPYGLAIAAGSIIIGGLDFLHA